MTTKNFLSRGRKRLQLWPIFAFVFFCNTSAWATPADTLWSENFEGDWTRDWNVDAGTWEVGIPTSGPNKAFRGQKCAATVLAGNYAPNVKSRLIRHTSFIVPSALSNPRLRFWHWYSISTSDEGVVQIKVGNRDWETISEHYFNSGCEVWTSTYIDLKPYAGMNVQIAFYFTSDPGTSNVSSGWYIDDVSVITGSLILSKFENWETGLGDWNVTRGVWEVGKPSMVGPNRAYNGENCAATVLKGNYCPNVDTRLVSPSCVVPPASSQPALRFWHWYSISTSDKGELQIKVGKGQWKTVAGPYVNSSSGIWSPVFVDLSAHADSTIQIAFHFTSDPGTSNISSGWYIDDITIDCVTGVSEISFEGDFAQSFALHQNHPNPFNPSTTISFDLPRASEVTLKIFDLVGHEVATLAEQMVQAGRYNFKWDASGMPGGVYFYRLQTEAFTQTRKLLLLR